MDEEISNLFKAISERDEIIMKLEQRISALEYQYNVMNSLMFVRDRVIENLRMDLTRLQQYTRRPNVSVFGIPKEDNEKPEQLKQKVETLVTEINSEITTANIDQFHRDRKSWSRKHVLCSITLPTLCLFTKRNSG